MILNYGYVDQQGGQLQLLRVSVGEDDTAVPGAKASQGEGGLADEIGITEHILVLHQEPDERHVRIEDLELANVVPNRIYSVVRWK